MRDKPDQDTTATAGGHDALGPGPTPGQTIDSAEAAVAHLLAGATNASHTARQAAAAVAQLVDRPGRGRSGCVTADGVLTIDHATRRLDASQRDRVVAWIVSWAPRLDPAGLKVAVAAAVERLRPEDAQQREQDAHDERYLAFTRFRGSVLLEGRLPSLEGEAFAAAVAAYAERLRAEGDGLTTGQRAADAVTAMTADLTAGGKVPTRNGAPAHVSVVVPLAEADRIAAGQPRRPLPLPDLGAHLPDHVTGHPDHDQSEAGRVSDGMGLFGAAVVAGVDTLGDAAARFLLCCADVSGALVDTSSTLGGMLGAAPLEPLAVGRASRLATPAQRRALALRDGGCVIPGCDVVAAACQTHHVTDWAAGGVTDTDSLALLCWGHHRQVDLGRWVLSRTTQPGQPYWTVTPTPRSAWRRRT